MSLRTFLPLHIEVHDNVCQFNEALFSLFCYFFGRFHVPLTKARTDLRFKSKLQGWMMAFRPSRHGCQVEFNLEHYSGPLLVEKRVFGNE